MRSRETTARNDQSSNTGPSNPISRRNLLKTVVSAVGLSSAIGIAGATDQHDRPDRGGSSKTRPFLFTVTNMEGEETLAGVQVECRGERARTDGSGTVVLEVEDGTHEVTAEKNQYEQWSGEIDMKGDKNGIYIPLHADTTVY